MPIIVSAIGFANSISPKPLTAKNTTRNAVHKPLNMLIKPKPFKPKKPSANLNIAIGPKTAAKAMPSPPMTIKNTPKLAAEMVKNLAIFGCCSIQPDVC